MYSSGSEAMLWTKELISSAAYNSLGLDNLEPFLNGSISQFKIHAIPKCSCPLCKQQNVSTVEPLHSCVCISFYYFLNSIYASLLSLHPVWLTVSKLSVCLSTVCLITSLKKKKKKKASPLFQMVSRTRPWFSANNPNGPNLATNLSKCYLKDFQRRSWLASTRVPISGVAYSCGGGESCPGSSLGAVFPITLNRPIIPRKIPCIVKQVSLEKSFLLKHSNEV